MSAAQSTARQGGPVQTARFAGLVYVTDATPGIQRLRNGRGFRYTTSRGRALRTPADLERIKRLAIPPAWQQVWICPILSFAAALPALRRQIAKDLSTPGLSKRKVVAAVVQLLEKTFIRVGNDERPRQPFIRPDDVAQRPCAGFSMTATGQGNPSR
jgi:DNA topoisomerase I